MERELGLLKAKNEHLGRECKAFRRPQQGRGFGKIAESIKDLAYRLGSPLTCRERGGDLSSDGKVPAIDFKEFNTKLTKARFDDPEELDILTKGFIGKIVEYACAALNARCNLTLYMGVNNDGIVTGIEVEDYELVSYGS